MHHTCTPSVRGGGVDMHEIDLGGEEGNISCDCVGKIWMGGKPDKLRNVGHSNVYSTD